MRELRNRFDELEEKVEGMESRMTELMERQGVSRRSDRDEDSNIEEVRSTYSGRSYISYIMDRSEGKMSKESGLSEVEVGKLRRLVMDKDKEERKNNIVIKGIEIPKEKTTQRDGNKVWAKEFLNESLGIECDIINCRESGKVIIVKLSSEEKKKEIMINKNKLKGRSIFIEHDLNWEDRQRQVRINKWVREQKERAAEIKADFGG